MSKFLLSGLVLFLVSLAVYTQAQEEGQQTVEVSATAAYSMASEICWAWITDSTNTEAKQIEAANLKAAMSKADASCTANVYPKNIMESRSCEFDDSYLQGFTPTFKVKLDFNCRH